MSRYNGHYRQGRVETYGELSSDKKQKVYKENVRLLSTLKTIERQKTDYLEQYVAQSRAVKLDLERNLRKSETHQNMLDFGNKMHCLRKNQRRKFDNKSKASTQFDEASIPDNNTSKKCIRNPTKSSSIELNNNDPELFPRLGGIVIGRQHSLPMRINAMTLFCTDERGQASKEYDLKKINSLGVCAPHIVANECCSSTSTVSKSVSEVQNKDAITDISGHVTQRKPQRQSPFPGYHGFDFPELDLGVKKNSLKPSSNHNSKTVYGGAVDRRLSASQVLDKQVDVELHPLQNMMVVSQQTNADRGSQKRTSLVSGISDRYVLGDNEYDVSLKIKRMYSEPKRHILRKMATEELDRQKKKRHSIDTVNGREFKRINLNKPRPEQALYRLHVMLQNSARFPLMQND